MNSVMQACLFLFISSVRCHIWGKGKREVLLHSVLKALSHGQALDYL